MSYGHAAQKGASVALPVAGETYVGEDGTVSQVLDDVIDANYEPTEEELMEYAEWMGMRLPEDKEFLWIAREGLKTPLPKEWKPCKTDDGEVYYFNFRTGESSWHHPMDGVIRKKFETEKARRQQSGGGSGGGAAVKAPAPAAETAKVSAAAPTGSVASHRMGAPVKSASPASPGLPSASLASTSLPGSSGGSRQPPAPRIVSEAERKLEEQIRQEMEKDWEAERQKAEALAAAAVASLRKLLDKDIAEAKEADAQRRAAGSSGAEEERRQRVAEARTRCDDRYGAQLRELERHVESTRTQLEKLEAERQRIVEQSRAERTAVESEAAAALDAELRRAAGEVAEAKERRLGLAKRTFTEEKATLEKRIADAPARARAEVEKRMQVPQTVAEVEARRGRLTEERGALEAALRAAAAVPTTDGGGAESGAELRKRLHTVEVKREATCEELRVQAARAQAALRQAKESERAALRAAIREAAARAKPQVKSPAGAGPPTPTAEGPAGATFFQRMSALRARYAREKVEAMGQLTREREARLAEGKSSAVSTPVRSSPTGAGSANSSFSRPSTVREEVELTGEDAAAAAARESYFAAVEREWSAAMARALTAAAANKQGAEVAVTAAVEADMEAFTKRLSARRERERRALEQRREKMLADHAAAEAARAAAATAAAAQREADQRAVREAMIEDAVGELLRQETAVLDRSAATVRARRLSHLEREGEVHRAEVEEELAAYLAAEMAAAQRRHDVASAAQRSTTTAAAKAPATPAADASGSASAKPSADTAAALAAQAADRHRLTTQLQSLEEGERERAGVQARELAEVEARLEARRAEQRRGTQALSEARVVPRASAATPVAAVAPAPVPLVRLVAPPDSVAKASHTARMAALEANYKAQEDALRRELAELHSKATATAAATTATMAPAQSPVVALSPLALATLPLPHATEMDSDAAARLLARQREGARRRHDVLHRAREVWQAQTHAVAVPASAASPAPSLPSPSAGLTPPSPAAELSRVASEPRLIAAVETLNRTLGALSSRVAQLENSWEGDGGGGPHPRSRSERPMPSRSRAKSARDTGRARRGSAGAHPSGLPATPPRRGVSADATAKDRSGLLRKWDRSLLAYGSEGGVE